MEGKENTLGLYKKLASDYEEGDPLLTLGPNCTTILTQIYSSSQRFSSPTSSPLSSFSN